MKDAEFKEFKLSLPKIKRRLKTLSNDVENQVSKKDAFTALQLCEIVSKYKSKNILEFQHFFVCFLKNAKDLSALLESKEGSPASELLKLPSKFLNCLLPHLKTAQAVKFFNRCKSAKLVDLLGAYVKMNPTFLDEIIKDPLNYQTHLLFELLLEYDQYALATRINRCASLWGKVIEAIIIANKRTESYFGMGNITRIDYRELAPYLKSEISTLSSVTALMIKKHRPSHDDREIHGLLADVDSHKVSVDFQRVMPKLKLERAMAAIALSDGIKKINKEFKGGDVTLFECKETEKPEASFKRFLQHCALLSKGSEAGSRVSLLAVTSIFNGGPTDAGLLERYEALKDKLLKNSYVLKCLYEQHNKEGREHVLAGYDRDQLQTSVR